MQGLHVFYINQFEVLKIFVGLNTKTADLHLADLPDTARDLLG